MNLLELRDRIADCVDDIGEEKANSLGVVVTTSNESIGARTCSGVVSITRGFDLESGQIRIKTEDKLYTHKRVAKIIKGNKYKCKACCASVGTFDKFCRICGLQFE